MKCTVEEIRIPEGRHLAECPETDAVLECPACGREEWRTISWSRGVERSGLKYAQCDRCTHRWLSYRPKAEWYAGYYADEGMRVRDEVKTIRGRLGRFIETTPLRRFALARSVSQNPRGARLRMMFDGVSRGSLLDVGCGLGGHLALYQSLGFDVFGTEENRFRVEHCQARGWRVSSFMPESVYDVVACTHVLEHVLDVDEFVSSLIRRVHQWLYIAVPDRSVEHLWHRTLAPVHTQVFSLRSLTTLLERFGFEVVRSLVDGEIQVLAQRKQKSSVSPNGLDSVSYRNGCVAYGYGDVACCDRTPLTSPSGGTVHIDMKAEDDGSDAVTFQFNQPSPQILI